MLMTSKNNLYFLRHCRTTNNIKHIITGQSDVPIIKDEIIEVNQFVLQNNVLLLCSPLLRCKQTADIFCKSINFSPQIITYPELRERNLGELEGLERKKAVEKYPEYFVNSKFIYNMTPPNGESYLQICERADKLINIIEGKLKANNVVLCSHNHILKIIYFKIMDIPIRDNWYRTKFENGKVYKIL